MLFIQGRLSKGVFGWHFNNDRVDREIDLEDSFGLGCIRSRQVGKCFVGWVIVCRGGLEWRERSLLARRRVECCLREGDSLGWSGLRGSSRLGFGW